MRRIAPPCARPRRCFVASLGLTLCTLHPLSVRAQPAAEEASPEPTSSEAEGERAAEQREPAPSAGATEEPHRDSPYHGSSYLGPVGGIHVVEAGSGAPKSLRLALTTDFFLRDDYLYDGDETRYLAGALSLSVTPVEHLELSAALTARSVRNRGGLRPLLSDGQPELVRSFGDPYFDVKSFFSPASGVTLGADVLLGLHMAPSEDEFDYAGTSVGVRANLSLDLRDMAADVPLVLRANAGYTFDASDEIVAESERERLDALRAAPAEGTPPSSEYRHLTPRHERLAYGVQRVDHASIALGLEAPLLLGAEVALHPLAEWELWVPVNRRGFDCAFVRDPSGEKLAGEDSCLADEGASAFPQRVTLGARLYPGLSGFSLLAGLELGFGSTTRFVRELAPNPPYRVFVGASYEADLAAPAPVTVVREVERRVEVPVLNKEGRIRGRLVERGTDKPVADARVSFPGRELSVLLSAADGRFVSYAFPPGEVQISVEAEGYESAACAALIPEQGGDAALSCELPALPRVGALVGHVLSAAGTPVPGANVTLRGPGSRSLLSGREGGLREFELPPGEYQVRAEHPDHFTALAQVRVEARKESPLELRLVPRPAKPSVSLDKAQLTVRGKLGFVGETAALDPKSELLLLEAADLLMRTPAVRVLEVQVHTDNQKPEGPSRALTQQRADAIRERLVQAGVEPDRVRAAGYGSSRPRAPNITALGRTQNRRVELRVIERVDLP